MLPLPDMDDDALSCIPMRVGGVDDGAHGPGTCPLAGIASQGSISFALRDSEGNSFASPMKPYWPSPMAVERQISQLLPKLGLVACDKTL